ncbi:hypothetical protein Pla111_16590 [Botrimarina hoheduenensis]|uniref:Uncharacterized protein n=2 Tax=Botrimarina hoheduenensis TaxID=2528000 RepID=A0A5C5W8I3_9BACT|nr:hypothetical protein Pla111_16590 [Botrimarina hoheduenensis]
MWRSFFLAIGVYCCLLGLEALAINRAVLKPQVRSGQVVSPSRNVTPPEWAPWSLLSGGAVVVLYSLTLHRAGGGD